MSSTSSAANSRECAVTISDPATVPIEITLAVLLAACIATGVIVVVRKWKKWMNFLFEQGFHSIDVDGSGYIAKEELWAGVLSLYIKLRQANIPADPPPYGTVMALLEQYDTDNDKRLSLDEFKRVMGALSAQALGRALTMVVFVSVWPLLVGLGYNNLSENAHAHSAPSWLPASLVCVGLLLDDLHLPPLVLTILGFVFIVPRIVDLVDRCTAVTHAAIVSKRQPLGDPLLRVPHPPRNARTLIN